MANYYGWTKTNYFRVTDENAYEKLFSGLRACDAELHDFTKTENGIIYHGFGAEGSIDYYLEPDEEDAEPSFDLFTENLQKILPEDEAFILIETGHEKLRYLTGFAIVVTKTKITSCELENWAHNTAFDIVKEANPNTVPQIKYTYG